MRMSLFEKLIGDHHKSKERMMTQKLDKTGKILYTFPDKIMYKEVFAQFSGLADCCSMGVIGRLGGVLLQLDTRKEPSLYESTVQPFEWKFARAANFYDLATSVVPKHPAFAVDRDFIQWAVMAQVLIKGTHGEIPYRIMRTGKKYNQIDVENNSQHKFWAHNRMRIKTWVLTDRMSKPSDFAPQARVKIVEFMEFIKRNRLGQLHITKGMPAAYHNTPLVGAFFVPDLEKLRNVIPEQLKRYNDMLEERWNLLKDKIPYKDPSINHSTDKVGKLW